MWWCITEGLASQGCLDSNGAGLPMQWDRVGEGKRRIFYPKKIWHEFGNVWRNKFWIKCHIIIFDPKKIMADFWGILREKKRLIIFKIGWVGVGGGRRVNPCLEKLKKIIRICGCMLPFKGGREGLLDSWVQLAPWAPELIGLPWINVLCFLACSEIDRFVTFEFKFSRQCCSCKMWCRFRFKI